MVRLIHCALVWAGGRTTTELAATGDAHRAGAALIGLALAAGAVLSLLGWLQWLLDDGRSFAWGLALALAALAAALFRQLAHARETAIFTVQRRALELIATLLLVPGAYLTAKAVPALLFQVHVDPKVAALAGQQHSVEDSAVLRLALGDAADRCHHVLRASLQNILSRPERAQPTVVVAALEPGAAECGRLVATADQAGGRQGQGVRKPVAGKVAGADSPRQRAQTKRGHAAIDPTAAEATRQLSCRPPMHCQLQRAARLGLVSGLEAWGATLAVLFLGMLQALLLIVLPLDGCARERQLRAIEDAVLRTALSDGTRKALAVRA